MVVIKDKITEEYLATDGTMYWDLEFATVFKNEEDAKKEIEQCEYPDNLIIVEA